MKDKNGIDIKCDNCAYNCADDGCDVSCKFDDTCFSKENFTVRSAILEARIAELQKYESKYDYLNDKLTMICDYLGGWDNENGKDTDEALVSQIEIHIADLKNLITKLQAENELLKQNAIHFEPITEDEFGTYDIVKRGVFVADKQSNNCYEVQYGNLLFKRAESLPELNAWLLDELRKVATKGGAE